MTNRQEKQSDSIKKIVLRSDEIFRGNKEIIIAHGDEQYRLLITKAGKLILNK